ncbi:MAG: putative intracellular protease/amidase [Saprospiraceae bacterium]|jgi:putative intracellular protease/amidase
MQRILIILALFCATNILSAQESTSFQTEQEQIHATIHDYIEGTSYNKMSQIKKAFYEEADLFLDNKDKSLWVVPISEYTSWYEKKEVGKFNGRIGRIISIDNFGNIATAKAEILIPEIELRFIDMFILKKIKGDWKIISKTANSEKSNRKGDKILFVTSNASFYKDTEIPTGNSFSEIVNAFNVFEAAGYQVDFVSPEGGAIPLAYINTSKILEKQYLYDNDFMYAMKNTLTPNQINPQSYKAVYYVGGGSAMFGVPENEEIQKISMSIYEDNEGVVSSVCHGTAGIVNLKTEDGKYLVVGRKVSGYPDSFEREGAEYFESFPFLIQKTIEERGGDFKFSPRNNSHVEVEGRLVTGQNHLSSAAVAAEIIKLIQKE